MNLYIHTEVLIESMIINTALFARENEIDSQCSNTLRLIQISLQFCFFLLKIKKGNPFSGCCLILGSKLL